MKNSKKLLTGPYLFWAIAFIIIPIIMIFYYGLTDADNNFTLMNLAEITTPENLKALGLSLLLSFISTVICLILAYPLAVILSNKSVNSSSFIVLIFILPMWMNFLLRTLAWQTLLEKNGVINAVLSFLRLPELNIINTPYAIVLGMVYNFLPFMILPIYTTIIKIDKSYLEAAKDLGATPARAFVKVTLPLSKAGIMSGVSMVFLPSMTNYVVSNYLTFRNVKIFGKLIDDYFTGDLWHDGSFIALLLLVFMFVFTWLTGGFSADEQTDTRGTSLW